MGDDYFGGPCTFCGRPGMMRQAPGAPYTAHFCDACYEKARRRQLIFPLGCLLVIAAIVAAIFLLIRRGC